MRHSWFVRRSLLVAFALAACGGRVGAQGPEDASVDSSKPAADTSPTPPAEASSEATPPPRECSVGDVEKRACGKCGVQFRVCGPDQTWLPWKVCEDEVVDAECLPGETRTSKCGLCGTSKDTCEKCKWVSSGCAGEGECKPGEIDTTSASCTVPGEVRTRVCDAKCKWGAFTACMK